MCGRYTLTLTPDEIRAEVPGIRSFPKLWNRRYNIAPSQKVPVIASDQPDAVQEFQWGLVPFWAHDTAMGTKLINARFETLDRKPSFRRACQNQRCLILADGFYEWQNAGKRKIPFYIHSRLGRLLTFGGLWERWQSPEGDSLLTCSIVTTEADDFLRSIHLRMPAIIPSEFRDAWLDTQTAKWADLKSLIRPPPKKEWEAYEVSSRVNDPSHEAEDCIRLAQAPL